MLIGSTPVLFFIRKNTELVKITVFIVERTAINYKNYKGANVMLNRIKRIIIGIREWLNRSDVVEFMNEIGRGMIYANEVNSLGGGVSIGRAL